MRGSNASPMRRYVAMIKSELALPWTDPKDHPQGLVDEYDTPVIGASHHTKAVPSIDISSDAEECYVLQTKASPRQRMGKYWSVIATGAGLFSDGYINASIGMVVTILTRIYGEKAIAESNAMSLISSMAFLGTVLGMIIFGFSSDYISRKGSMIVSTLILILLSLLIACSWGAGMPDNPHGMFACITAYRAIIGLGIGGEYPAGSTACAEASQQISSGKRNRWFVWFTNFMIDTGFIIAAFVAWLLLYICGVPAEGSTHGLSTVWRLLLGLGAIAPCSLLYLRLKFEENEQFSKYNLKRSGTPYWLAIKYYFPRLVLVSFIWFLYDFCSYSFGIYSSQIISLVVHNNNIKTQFGWTVLFYVFYWPGSFLGALFADYIGPRLTLLFGAIMQGVVGLIMVSQFDQLKKSAGPLVAAYGVFTALGEFSAGDNIGLIASKTSSSAIRGRYYGIAAAIGKVGAFVGTYIFPVIAKPYGGLGSAEGQKVLLYISSALCILTGLLALFLPCLSQTAVNDEDVKFRRYLAENGFDISLMGNAQEEPLEKAQDSDRKDF